MGGRGGGSPGRKSAGDWRAEVQTEGILNSVVQRPSADVPSARLAQAQRDLGAMLTGEWQRLPGLRDRMAARGYNIGEQDAALEKLAVQRDVRVIPIANLKSLTPDDRRAAVFLGGEWKHAIRREG